ncbi:MAG: hypothetical protein AAGB97_09320 [Dehalococcoidia bacterium]|nr:hypothetical protein [Chloroflexota bacterium]MBT9160945.1 hypothetical protein [Chloroflexota bacterium]
MGKRGFRKQIESLEVRIKEHEDKITREKGKSQPNEGKIHHWETEIEAFKKSGERAKKRLRRGK